ncbi:Isochorismatase hydrolase [Clavulina sp. PMI_390]|nr:Isochorismatase hydrolase [Clavulina sp. PMI_390]
MVIPEIAELLKREAAEKSSLGGPTPIVIMGIEAHICVQQTALQLAQLGYEVYVLADGVSSIHHAGEVPIALDRMRQSGVLVTTSESFLFNAMGDASRAEFKAFAKLIKEAKAGTEGALGGLLSF